jgi:RNA-directed DNA polymerase
MQGDGLAMAEPKEIVPPPVPSENEAIQGGEACAPPTRWSWVEPSVWPRRMLAALDEGVKGGVWFGLMDKVYARRNLESAYRKVASNRGSAGVDQVSIQRYGRQLEREIDWLHEALRDGRYVPQAVRRAWIPKGQGEKRPLGIPTVRDRVAQTALRNVLEPIFEREFAQHSYGFRPGRSAHDALGQVTELLAQGYRYVVDADLRKYFDSIPKDRLMKRIREHVADSRVLMLIEQYLNQQVMDGLDAWTPERGTPQGAVISPLLANIYLNPLDHEMAAQGYRMIRYADDFVVLCRSQAEAEQALEYIRAWMTEEALTLHPEKTRIVNMNNDKADFEFLGVRFKHTDKQGDMQFPRAKSVHKLHDSIRAKTRRTHGHSLTRIIESINPILRGWFVYFKRCHRNAFPEIDQWVRMRLRSILRKRHHGKGRERGYDHIRWPNDYFTEQGLFSLKTAHAQAAQSPRG